MPQTSKLLDASGRPIPTALVEDARRGGFLGGRVAHRGASTGSQELALFNPPNTSADGANRWERQKLADRARDLVRNESEAGSAVKKSVGMVIGSGWKLQAKPDHKALGISPQESRALGKSIESAVARWATHPGRWCDGARHHDFGGLLRLAFTEWETVNDVMIVMGFREEAPSPFATCVRIVDSDRLCNPYGYPDDEYLREGVALDGYGAAVGYHLRRHHPLSLIHI